MTDAELCMPAKFVFVAQLEMLKLNVMIPQAQLHTYKGNVLYWAFHRKMQRKTVCCSVSTFSLGNDQTDNPRQLFLLLFYEPDDFL